MIVLPNGERQVRCSEELDDQKEALHEQGQERRRARFSRRVDVVPCLHIMDYTPEERSKCWYSSGERENMRSEVRHAVHMLQRNALFECRGLESRLASYASQAAASSEARQYVILQQHHCSGYDLAQNYKKLSYKNKMTAYLLAIKDAKQAKLFHTEVEQARRHTQIPSRVPDFSGAASVSAPIAM